jgi:hypothetical protein
MYLLQSIPLEMLVSIQLTGFRLRIFHLWLLLAVMTIRATKFTPEVLLSAPRRSAGQPNPDGSQVIYTVSTYDFAKHAKKNEHRLLDVRSQQTSLITDDQTAAEVKWLNELWIVVLFGGEDGTTTVKVGKADSFTNR